MLGTNILHYERKRRAGGGGLVAFFTCVRLVGTGWVDDERDITGAGAAGCLRFTTIAVVDSGRRGCLTCTLFTHV